MRRGKVDKKTCPARAAGWTAFPATLLAVAASSTPVAATPYWCSSESLNTSEQTVCADGLLSQLDIALNDAYREARRVDPVLDQRSWLAQRNACVASISCLESAYRSRIAELRAIASGTAAMPGTQGHESTPSAGAVKASPLPEVSAPPVRPEPNSQSSGRAVDNGNFSTALEVLPVLEEMTPRPWCDARRLNSTEQVICADPDLSRLDALLELVYGRATARDEDVAQLDWLRSERDACDTDRLCIAETYADRIAALNEPYARAAEERYGIEIPAGHFPPPGSCRVWYPDRPPGHQPPPTSCDGYLPPGAVLIKG